MLVHSAFAGEYQKRTADELIRALLGRILRDGVTLTSVSGGKYRELLCLGGTLLDPMSRLMRSSAHPQLFDPLLAAARLLFLLSGSMMLCDLEEEAPAVRRYSDDGIVLPGSSYGARVFYPVSGPDQVTHAARILATIETGKRAFVSIYHSGDLARAASERGTSDVPCAIGLALTSTQAGVHATTIMRANDLLSLGPYNLFEFSILAEFISRSAGRELLSYSHFGVSMHVRTHRLLHYTDDPEARIAEVCGEPPPTTPRMDAMPAPDETTRTSVIRGSQDFRRLLRGSHSPSLAELKPVLESMPPWWRDILVCYAGFLVRRRHGPEAAANLIISAAEELTGWGPLSRLAAGAL